MVNAGASVKPREISVAGQGCLQPKEIYSPMLQPKEGLDTLREYFCAVIIEGSL
jgi:hypothetical protein